MHRRHALGFQQSDDEILVRRDQLAALGLFADQPRHRRVDVEGAFGLGADQAVGLVEHGDDQIAALFEGGFEEGDAILRAGQSLERGPLRDGGGP